MRIIKRLFIYTTIIGALMFSILVVFGFIYQDKVVETVKAELNKTLNAEINVQTIDLSFVSDFPQASVNLKYVVGFESKSYSNNPDTLFAFEQFALSFNVIDIFNGHYVLNGIQAENGKVNLEIAENGLVNYSIFKEDTSQTTSSFQVDLSRVQLKNCEVGYRDFSTSDKYRFIFPKIIAKGSFSDKEVHTALFGSTYVKELQLDETSYLEGEDVHVDIGVEINLETGAFQISRGYLTLRDQYDFNVKGKTGTNSFHYSFEAKALDLNQAESLIPSKHIKFINTYQLDGAVDMSLDVERKKGATRPEIAGNFELSRGRFKNKSTNISVDIPHAKGAFDLGKSNSPVTTTLDLEEFEIITSEGTVNGTLNLRNLKHPKYKLEAQGNVDLLQLTKLVDLGEDFAMSGTADFKAKLTGTIQEMDSITSRDIQTIRGQATIQLKQAAFEIKDIPQIKNVSAQIELNQDVANIKSFSGNVSQSETMANIQVSNWLGFVLDQKKMLRLRGNVTTKVFDSSHWTSKQEESKGSEFELPRNISYTGHVEIGRFKSEKIELTNLRTNVAYYPQKLRLSDTYVDGFGGKMYLDLQMNQLANHVLFDGHLKTQKVQIEQFMKTFDNFGQKTLTYEHFKGDLDCSIDFRFKSDHSFKVNQRSIYVDGDLILVNGELIEYKLLYDIPKDIESNKIIALFVNLDAFEKRLHHIKFDTISNHITIQNEMINIPRMDIHSSAMNISIQGKHSFDNEMDYYMNFNLKQVLSKKERITTEYGYIKDDNLGNRMVYLHVYTKNGEIEVDLDKNGSKKHNQAKVQEELNEAKSVLKEELGLFKNDTSVVVKEEEEIFEYDVDLGEFGDTVGVDSGNTQKDSVVVKKDSSLINKILKKKKKKKKEKEDFEEWDFDDDDY